MQDERGWKEILRNRLRACLASVCAKEGIEIRWNMQFVRYEEKGESVDLHFENGEQTAFDLVVGGW
jgi:2-polyprenyl-6-methoxyphenol hydroxylase-like FAD-dependent oxidoreductase